MIEENDALGAISEQIVSAGTLKGISYKELPIHYGTLIPISEATFKSLFDRHNRTGWIIVSANRTEDEKRQIDRVLPYQVIDALGAVHNGGRGDLEQEDDKPREYSDHHREENIRDKLDFYFGGFSDIHSTSFKQKQFDFSCLARKNAQPPHCITKNAPCKYKAQKK